MTKRRGLKEKSYVQFNSAHKNNHRWTQSCCNDSSTGLLNRRRRWKWLLTIHHSSRSTLWIDCLVMIRAWALLLSLVVYMNERTSVLIPVLHFHHLLAFYCNCKGKWYTAMYMGSLAKIILLPSCSWAVACFRSNLYASSVGYSTLVLGDMLNFYFWPEN